MQLIREVSAEVELVRGLKRTANFKVEILDDELFVKAVREKALKELTPAVVAAERARWLAFGLAPPAADPRRIYLEVLDEQVAGFYDPFTKALTVRRNAPEGALRAVLAHEIEHALQDQVFGIPDFAKLPDDDARLAASALYEGDAMAAMLAVSAHHAHRPVRLAIVNAAAALRTTGTSDLLRLSGHSSALAGAPAILREELVVPYVAGLALVSEVFQRGGFALVDQMFRHPPASSHQVLHPDAYLRGEPAAAISPPAAPPGTRVISTGRMGELGTRVALELCVDRQVVKDFTDRWQGDAYTIFEGPQKSLGLVWSTAWNTGGAAPIANLFSMEQPCWDEAATGERGAAGWTMGAFSKVRSAGNRVVLARGAEQADPAARAALAAPLAPPAPAKPPLGDVPAPAVIERAHVANGRLTSARLGLEGELPAGYDADVSGATTAELAVQRAGPSGAFVSLSLVPEPLTPEGAEAFFQSAAAQAASARMGGKSLTFVGKGQRKIAELPAEERSWDSEGGPFRLRIALAPICGGRAYLALFRLHSGETGRAAIDRFVESLKRTGEPLACKELE